MIEYESHMIEESKKAKRIPRIIFQILILVAIYIVANLLQVVFGMLIIVDNIVSNIVGSESQETIRLIINLFGTAIAYPVILIYVRKIEGRSFAGVGFSRPNLIKDYLQGLVVGIALLFSVTLVLYLLGNIEFAVSENINWMVIILIFCGFLIQGMSEELMWRGMLMNSIIARKNIIWGIVISSLMFSLVHLGNPNVTFVGILNIFLFGIFIAIYSIRKGSIWGAGAVHSSWNFIISCVIGVQVSGISTPSIFQIDVSGSNLLSGGDFGFEGGIILSVILLAVNIFLVLKTFIKDDSFSEPIDNLET